MKQTKKQRWKNIISSIIIIVIIILVLIPFYWFGDFPYNEDKQCKHKREDWVKDRCVCKEYNQFVKIKRVTVNFDDIPTINKEPSNFCKKFRLKTQVEKDIDDCNNNPREDKKCKCVEQRLLAKVSCASNPDVKVEIINVTSLNKETIDKLGDKEWVCIKSRPKTECEKGNSDWVEENKCIQNTIQTNDDLYWKIYNNCKIREGCVEEIDFSIPCIKTIDPMCNKEARNESDKRMCIKIQTICREKN